MNVLSLPLDRGFESKAEARSKAGRGFLRLVVVESGFVEIVVMSETILISEDVARYDEDKCCSPMLRNFPVCVSLEPGGPLDKGRARDGGLMELHGRVFLTLLIRRRRRFLLWTTAHCWNRSQIHRIWELGWKLWLAARVWSFRRGCRVV